jgi:hypothetical protein
MGSNREHALFRQFPQTGQQRTSAGMLPVPYHVYDGRALFIGGTADLAAVRGLLEREHVTPYETTGGRALMGIWVTSFTDASLGPHYELQFSIFVAREARPPVEPHPFAILKLLTMDPAARMLCHGLWNDTEPVVAYNRELLGLNAFLAEAALSLHRGRSTFSFSDRRTGQAILSGTVTEVARPPLRSTVAMMRFFGWRGMARIMRQPYLTATVVNTISERQPSNLDARTYTRNAREVVRFFDPKTDHLTLMYRPYLRLDFMPQFVEHMHGFKFVYLHPEQPPA